jgi:hypothetical protein
MMSHFHQIREQPAAPVRPMLNVKRPHFHRVTYAYNVMVGNTLAKSFFWKNTHKEIYENG